VVVGSRQMYWTPLGCGGRVESKGGVPIGSW
jgi:hypothetical protein